MKVLVTSNREYRDGEKVFALLSSINKVKPITKIIVDSSPGAGIFAVRWSVRNKVPRKIVTTPEARAGKINKMFKEEPKLVIALDPGPTSKLVVRAADHLGVKTYVK